MKALAHEREEREISHKLEHVRQLARAQESNLRDAEAIRKRAEADFEGETREWAIRIDAQKREHEAAVVRLEQLHREAAGLEREASERRAAYEAERAEFREELDAEKKAWERERSSTEATLAEKAVRGGAETWVVTSGAMTPEEEMKTSEGMKVERMSLRRATFLPPQRNESPTQPQVQEARHTLELPLTQETWVRESAQFSLSGLTSLHHHQDAICIRA